MKRGASIYTDSTSAAELTAKATLAAKINELIQDRGLSQTEAAEIIGTTQSKISQLCRRKLDNISLERLMLALVSFDQSVEIVIKPAPLPGAAAITVAV